MNEANENLIEVEDLVVEYGKGAKKVRAIDGITFGVRRGECVGFIGPNGAGKSTTIKTLMGFIFPASGTVRVFGSEAGTVESRRRLGYLPEVALYYPFMKARELLTLYGGLQGISNAELKRRIPELLDEVGLAGKGNVLLRNFSKGMQQRLGIAQAIIAGPELLVFDEMSSGLDPVGRHDLREVLRKLRQQGTTIFFSSHELVEVEELCDRVIMVNHGKIVTSETVANLMKPMNRFEIVFELPAGVELPAAVANHPVQERGNQRAVSIAGVNEYTEALQALSTAGARLINTESKTQTLEEYFISLIRQEPGKAAVPA